MAQSLLMRLTKALDFQLRPHHLAQDPKLPYTYLHQNLAKFPNLRYHLLRQQHRMPLELTYLTMFFYEKGRIVGNWRSMEAGLVTNLVRYVQYRVHEQMPTHSTNVVVITVEDIMYEKINYELKMNPRLTPLCNDWVRMVGECFADGNVVILSLGAAHPELTKVMELNYFLQAITRAKNSLYIVGNMDKYKHKAHWRALLNHANKENRCFTVTGTTPFNPRHLEIRSPPVPTHMPHSPPHHRGYAPHHSRGLPPCQRNPTPPFRGRSPPRRRSPPTPHPNYRTTHVRPEPNQNYNLPPSDPRNRAPNPLQDRITNMRQQATESEQ
ncbi:hypothetical protein B566_EDAN018379 [Ephemera danica]|nr:hypothetical protein B566_EDAN018379 [Ephemera danica]